MSALRHIFVIADNVSGDESPLFLAPTFERGIVQFGQFLAQSPNRAQDYDLYAVGTYIQGSVVGSPAERSHIVNGASSSVRDALHSHSVKDVENVTSD